MNKKNNSGGFWIGLFLGAILSVILLMLTGTKEGRRFGKKFKRKVEDHLDDISEEINKEGGIIDKASKAKETALINASQKSREIGEQVKKIKADVSKNIENRLSEAQDKVSDEEDTDTIASKIGNKFFKRQGKS